MNNKIDIYVEEMIKRAASTLEAKKAMMKEYVLSLQEIIDNGATHRDENIESLQIQWQKYFNKLEKIIDEEQRENALDNMELIDEHEEHTSYSLDEVTQDILDRNNIGSFTSF